jgi:hypothetical protein
MLTRDLDQWSSEAIRGVEQQPLEARFEEVGRTELVGDGIALVSGLPRLQLGELVTFEDGSAGFALTLERDHIGVVLLDPSTRIEAPSSLETGDVREYRSGSRCSGASLIRSADRLTRKVACGPNGRNRSSDLRQGSLNVSWSPSRSKPGP